MVSDWMSLMGRETGRRRDFLSSSRRGPATGSIGCGGKVAEVAFCGVSSSMRLSFFGKNGARDGRCEQAFARSSSSMGAVLDLDGAGGSIDEGAAGSQLGGEADETPARARRS